VPDETAAARAAQAAVQAETCDDCGHYLKIMHGDRDLPVAVWTVTPAAGVQPAAAVANLMLVGEPEHGHTLVADPVDGSAPGQPQGCRRPPAAQRQALAGTLAGEARALLDARAPGRRLALAGGARLAPRLQPVLNLTGTVIHTNLGRALLADSALQHLLAMMAGPNNLEYDLASGGRGDRDSVVEELLCTLTGAEAATVVNNNAAAVLLTIAALARGREVIVSRGELVEIGGAFRMPDVMASAGATLVEVGTTNRTHPRLRARHHPAHRAADEGAHQQLRGAGLHRRGGRGRARRIAHARGLPLATDLGSGALVDLARPGACRASPRRRRSWPPAATSSPSAATSCSAARRPG
jgi:L-seryl-tRNA(Ser) seleniumtransferase